LNELVTWIDSSFNRTSASASADSQDETMSGVRLIHGAMRPRAAKMSAVVMALLQYPPGG